MQKSRLFGSGRAAALEKRLLSRDEIKSMTDSEPMRVLRDKGYGGEYAGDDDEEKLIRGELRACRKLTEELLADEKAAYALFLRADIQNLKSFIKLRLLGRDITPENADENGNYDPVHLALCVKLWEFDGLNEDLQKELAALDEELALRRDPQTVSVWLDRAYFRIARKCGDAVLMRMLGTECDYVNLITLLRMRGTGIERDAFIKLLMPEYEIETKLIADNLTGDIDAKKLTRTMPERVRRIAMPAIEAGDAATIQKLRDETLTQMIREHRSEMETIYPVVWYYIARQREAEIIRLCCNMRRCGKTPAEIQEKVRELYG